MRKTFVLLMFTTAFGAAIACGDGENRQLPVAPSDSGGVNAAGLTAPVPDSPSQDQEVDSMRPTLRVGNATSSGSGPRTYDFQISDTEDFSTQDGHVLAANRAGVPEGSDGTTSFTPLEDLAPDTRYYWRARAVQGASTGPWSGAAGFRTRIGGYNRPGQLYDPLFQGLTVGTRVGATTFVPGQGLRIDNQNSYLRYDLPRTVPSGEFSMEVRGLRPNGPGGKLKVFSMMSGTGDLVGDPYELSVQYRGLDGNPNNCIAFKARWGSDDVVLEPNRAQRSASVVSLNSSRWYFFQATWDSRSFRLVVRDGGPGGAVVYDRRATAASGRYAPSPHYAYLGATSGIYGLDTGSWPGVVFRNVWLGNGPRPASLGAALSR